MATSSENTLVLRADAGSQIGTGHVMRCLALAQAWQADGGRAIFVSNCESQGLCRRVKDAGIDFVHVSSSHPDPEDLRQTLIKLRKLQPGWLVLDGYHFDPEYQRAVRAAGCSLLVIDDSGHWPEYHANVLLNQNMNAVQLRYTCDPDTAMLLDTRYALIRSEFHVWQGYQRKTPEIARRILVSLGGSDPANLTLKVIQALHQLRETGLEARIVIGPANSHSETLLQLAQGLSLNVQCIRNATNMAELMAWADIAVSSAGSICWELAYMGLPSVAFILAENQRRIGEELGKRGIVLNLGWHEQVTPAEIAQVVNKMVFSPKARAEMSDRGRDLVDGEGADRVVMRMRGQNIRLRRVKEADARLLWEWANDPDVRAVSFSAEAIPWEAHLRWLASQLADSNCFFYIAINEDGAPVGQIRCDVSGSEAVISISLDTRFRGKGCGAAAIELAAQRVYQVSAAKLIHAYVKPDNQASINVFQKAGFRKMGTALMRGQPAIDMVLREAGEG